MFQHVVPPLSQQCSNTSYLYLHDDEQRRLVVYTPRQRLPRLVADMNGLHSDAEVLFHEGLTCYILCVVISELEFGINFYAR